MLGDRKKTLIIAEVGVNHNGDVALARELVQQATLAGADIVKFQVFSADLLVGAHAPKAAYQKKSTDINESQLEMLRRLEFSPNTFQALSTYCADIGIAFLATPFDHTSIKLLTTLGLDTLKIPSGEINNLPYLRYIGSFGKDLIMSTGMSELNEVGMALDILEKAGTPRAKISLLHCTTEYPAPYREVNLRAMGTIREAFPGLARVGYSDHTPGIEIPVAAVAMGAEIIEKHFTLDKNMDGPDHRASLEPQELTAMVTAIRNVEVALGNGDKRPTASELPNRAIVRKSIVAARDILVGEILTEENIAVKRPGTGISPMEWDRMLGSVAQGTLKKDSLLPDHWMDTRE